MENRRKAAGFGVLLGVTFGIMLSVAFENFPIGFMIGYKNPKPSIRGLGVNSYAELLRFPITEA